MSWLTVTNQQLEYDIDKYNADWITSVPWYNTYICKQLHRTVFQKYIRHARTERYKLMCSVDTNEKQQPLYVDGDIIGGGNAIPSNYTAETLDSLSATFDFIDC